MKFVIGCAVVILILAGAAFFRSKTVEAPAVTSAPLSKPLSMSFSLSSSAFSNNAMMPRQYTCDGNQALGVIPPLAVAGTPSGTQSLALIMDDPDAPGGWVHWLVFNIPPKTAVIEEGKEPPGVSGKNSWGTSGYGGPCPPSGAHRYVFTLYALDTELTLPGGSGKEELLQALKGHILSEAQLVGRYRRE